MTNQGLFSEQAIGEFVEKIEKVAFKRGQTELLKTASKIFKEWNCKAKDCSDPLCGHGRCVNDMVAVLKESTTK